MVSWPILQKNYFDISATTVPCERLLFGRLHCAVEEVIGKCEQASLPEQLVENSRQCNWCPTGLCAQLAALHAADSRLHCQVQLQPHHQVC